MSGSSEELYFNEIGNFAGAAAHRVQSGGIFALDPGSATIAIQADGPWVISTLQEFPASGSFPPKELAGIESTVFRWLQLEVGQYVVTASHEGTGNFIVWLLKSDGTTTELVVNDIGASSGQYLLNVQDSLFSVEPGLYAIDIRANGVWRISIN